MWSRFISESSANGTNGSTNWTELICWLESSASCLCTWCTAYCWSSAFLFSSSAILRRCSTTSLICGSCCSFGLPPRSSEETCRLGSAVFIRSITYLGHIHRMTSVSSMYTTSGGSQYGQVERLQQPTNIFWCSYISVFLRWIWKCVNLSLKITDTSTLFDYSEGLRDWRLCDTRDQCSSETVVAYTEKEYY